jgi:alpha-tubulin suppressor-like RCC1 family protein
VRARVRAACTFVLFAALAPLACSLVVSTSGLSGAPDDGKGEAGGDVDAQVGRSDATTGLDGSGADAGPPVFVVAGRIHSCAAVNGRASCWGENARGQLGDGSTTRRHTPVPVQGLPAGAVTAIGAGDEHTCAVVAGDLYCWGSATAGALGPGASSDSVVPIKVTGLPGPVTSVAGGDSSTCAIAGTRVYCWGDNGHGRLGDGTTLPHKAPSAVLDANGGILQNVAQLSVGGDHACALLTSPAGRVVCWGHSDGGALGNAGAGGESAKAVTVEGLPGPAQSVSIAEWHACAVVNGAAWCWGTGADGQLGNGGNSDSVTPVPVGGLGDDVTLMITAGGPIDFDATCAVRRGDLSCWGQGKFFRLGDGQMGPRATPIKVSTLPASVVSLAGGENHWCAHLTNGEVRCWGAGGLGQVGDGAAVDRALPVVVNGL